MVGPYQQAVKATGLTVHCKS